MIPEDEKNHLFHELRARSYAVRIITIQRLRELEEEIKRHYERGMFNPEFYRERLSHFNFKPPSEMPDAKSIILIAVPSPQTGVVFHWNGESKTLILPPTYVGYATLPSQIESLVNEILNPWGYRAIKTLKFPIKPLAVHSGLAEYGRNNITYVEGMGSFHHLFAFYSSMPCEQDEWREMKVLERCNHCRACIIQCPTGAIGEDRFLLHAERCLTFHNEKPADIPFPAWINPAWHNSIYGCMVCQRYCPEDKKFRDWVVPLVEFSPEETMVLVDNSSQTHLPPSITEKLHRLELSESYAVLRRNLAVLLNKE